MLLGPRLCGRRCSEGHEGYPGGQVAPHPGELAVGWPEVVAPGRYAVCLIHRNQGQLVAAVDDFHHPHKAAPKHDPL